MQVLKGIEKQKSVQQNYVIVTFLNVRKFKKSVADKNYQCRNMCNRWDVYTITKLCYSDTFKYF